MKTYTECKGRNTLLWAWIEKCMRHFRIYCCLSNEGKKWAMKHEINDQCLRPMKNMHTAVLTARNWYQSQHVLNNFYHQRKFKTIFIKSSNIGPIPALYIQSFTESCGCMEGTMTPQSKLTPHPRPPKVEMEETSKTEDIKHCSTKMKRQISSRGILLFSWGFNCSILTPLKPTRVWHWDQWSLNFILKFKTFLC